jgi:hypothetical protein
VYQINAHYSATTKPEMTIEKLQKVASAQVEPEYKAMWLRWWNSGSMRRAAYRFLPAGFKEAELDLWLNKATFWAQVILYSLNHSNPSFFVAFKFSSLYYFFIGSLKTVWSSSSVRYLGMTWVRSTGKHPVGS